MYQRTLNWRSIAVCSFCSLLLVCTTTHTVAQETVQLKFGEQMELRSFIEYVAERTGLRILYDESVLQKKVSVVIPEGEEIQVDTLLALLNNVLRSESFMMVDSEDKKFKQILPTDRMPEVARPTSDQTALDELGAAEPLTRVFKLKFASPSDLATLLAPIKSKAGASILAVENQKILIVTDVAENVRRIAQLIEILDNGTPLIDTRFVPVQYVKADDLATQLNELLAARAKAAGTNTEEEGTGIEVAVEPRTNQLILIGNASEIALAEKLLKELDKQLPTSTGAFLLRYTSPAQLEEAALGIIEGRTVRPPFRARVEGNSLVVESTPEVLRMVEQLRRRIDTREAPDEQSPIRFYKVKNVPAQELLLTIQSIFTGEIQQQRRSLPERRRTTADLFVPGANYPPVFGGPFANPYVPIPQTPALQTAGMDSAFASEQTASGGSQDSGPRTATTSFSNELIGDAQVTVDIHTNTIIVVAKPEVQRIYATLIEQLDERRPQVLVEAKVVIIDTSDDFTLGVEVAGGDRTGTKKSFAFTSYGFSEVDPVSGALQIVPGVGFNGTLVDPTTADVVVRALSTHRRARVTSSPRILVNDNAEGELTSILEIPFTSVNASQTVATTSFAGFAEAGTTINVTPTISDDNYLQMDYTVTLNTFTGDGADGVPPPRQTNEVRSRVTVPDGYTVIVGGLTTKNDVLSYRGLPWLEKLPVVRDLTGTTSNSWDETSLFVFLRPIILRDDKFKDLKYISDKEMCDASIPGEYPGSASLSIP